jgi:hypothetical protein
MRAYRIILLVITVLTACILDASAQEKKISRLVISGDYFKNNEGAKLIIAHKNAVVRLTGQDSKLEADDVSFDEQTQILNAVGNVRITRQGNVSAGQRFVFRITSTDYLVTDSRAELVDIDGVPFPLIPNSDKSDSQLPVPASRSKKFGRVTSPREPIGDFPPPNANEKILNTY